MNVRTFRAGDVLTLQRRSVDVDPTSTYREIGVRSFARGLFIKQPVTGAEVGDKRVFHVEPGDLVVSNVFAWEGAVALASGEHDGTIGSHRFMTWMGSEDVHIPYVVHYLSSGRGIAQLRAASPGSAGRNRTLSIKNFESIEIPLPGLDDQRRIAQHLDGVESAARRATVVGLIKTAESTLARADDGPRIPLGELVVEAKRPSPVVNDQLYRMAGVRWYGEGTFVREVIKGEQLRAKSVFHLERGDLVYNRLFAWKRSFALVNEDGLTASNEFPTFTMDPARVDPRVLLHLLLSDDFSSQVNSASAGSTPTSRNRLKVAEFLHLEVPLPTGDVQEAVLRRLHLLDRLRPLQKRANELASAMLPAARNEIFNSLR